MNRIASIERSYVQPSTQIESPSSVELLAHTPLEELVEQEPGPVTQRYVGGRALIAFEGVSLSQISSVSQEAVTTDQTGAIERTDAGQTPLGAVIDGVNTENTDGYGKQLMEIHGHSRSPVYTAEQIQGSEVRIRIDPSSLFPAAFLYGRADDLDHPVYGKHGLIEDRPERAKTIEGAATLLDEMPQGEWHDYAARWLARHHIHENNLETAERLADKIDEDGWGSHTLSLIEKRMQYLESEGFGTLMPPDDRRQLHEKIITRASRAYNSDKKSAFNEAVVHEALSVLPDYQGYGPWEDLKDNGEKLDANPVDGISNTPDDWEVGAENL